LAEVIRVKKGEIVSKLAAGKEMQREGFAKDYNIQLSSDEHALVKSACQIALEQAGQVLAAMIAASAVKAGYKGEEAIVPVEGSVFTLGHGVKTTVRQELDRLLPNNALHFSEKEANGMHGVAKMAMVYSSETTK
jgi:hexokinase